MLHAVVDDSHRPPLDDKIPAPSARVDRSPEDPPLHIYPYFPSRTRGIAYGPDKVGLRRVIRRNRDRDGGMVQHSAGLTLWQIGFRLIMPYHISFGGNWLGGGFGEGLIEYYPLVTLCPGRGYVKSVRVDKCDFYIPYGKTTFFF